MAVDTTGRYTWTLTYVEGAENPYQAFGTRSENGRITVTYSFAQSTAELLITAIQVAMGTYP